MAITTTNTTQPENANNSTPTRVIDDVYPTITIIDNTEKNEIKQRSACGCLNERTVVIAIFSMYFFWGIIDAAISLSGLPSTQSQQDLILSIFDAVVSLLFVAASAVGLNAMNKENVKLMRRLSIVFIALILLRLVLAVTSFAISVGARDDLVAQCNRAVQQQIGDSDIDCNQLVNMFLVKAGMTLFFLEVLQFYFAYVIFRHSRGMVARVRYPYPLASAPNSDAPPTYFVYASQSVPTADNWVPPPTYNGNPNNIPVSGDNKFSTGV